MWTERNLKSSLKSKRNIQIPKEGESKIDKEGMKSDPWDKQKELFKTTMYTAGPNQGGMNGSKQTNKTNQTKIKNKNKSKIIIPLTNDIWGL